MNETTKTPTGSTDDPNRPPATSPAPDSPARLNPPGTGKVPLFIEINPPSSTPSWKSPTEARPKVRDPQDRK